MKKLLLLLLLILTLTSCNTVTDELPQGEDLTIEQAYKQYGKMLENFQKEIDKNPLYDSVYYKEEHKKLDYFLCLPFFCILKSNLCLLLSQN